MEMLEVIDTASGGIVEYAGVEAFKAFIAKTNRGLAKENSINPRPKFHYEEKLVGSGIEVYLCVEDLSNNWLEITVKIDSKSTFFSTALNGYTRLPVIEPNSKGSLFFLGSFNTTQLSVDAGEIYIEALVSTNDKDEKARGLLVFSGSDRTFLETVRNSETDLKNIVLEIEPLVRGNEYSVWSYYGPEITQKINRVPYVYRNNYTAEVNKWYERINTPALEKECNLFFAKQIENRTKLKLTNRSTSKTYKNLEITVEFAQDMLFIDEYYDLDLPKVPDFVAPKENNWLNDFGKFPPYQHDIIGFDAHSLAEIPISAWINSDINISKSEYSERILTIKVRELRAKSSIILTENEGYAILAINALGQDKLKCTIELREESFGYLSKDILVSVRNS